MTFTTYQLPVLGHLEMGFNEWSSWWRTAKAQRSVALSGQSLQVNCSSDEVTVVNSII